MSLFPRRGDISRLLISRKNREAEYIIARKSYTCRSAAQRYFNQPRKRQREAGHLRFLHVWPWQMTYLCPLRLAHGWNLRLYYVLDR